MKLFKAFVDFVEKHLIKIELICFFSAIVIGIFTQIFDDKLANCEFLKKVLELNEGEKFNDLLDAVDRYALIVGGISFFVEDWINEDTENKVFILLIVISIIVARLFQIIDLQYLSLIITCVNVIIISIPLLCFIYRNIVDSHRRDLRKG